MRLPRKSIGRLVDPAEWDAMVDLVASLMPMRTDGSLTSHGVKGVHRKVRPGLSGASAGALPTYKLQSVTPDYLICKSWDGTNLGATDVYIAKWEQLRELPFARLELGIIYTFTYIDGPDGNNRIRNKTDPGGVIEQQMVAPVWVVDDIIYGVKARTYVGGPDGKEIGMIMLGAARQWTTI